MSDFPLPSNIGSIKRVAGVDQAANVEITDAVPSGKWWYLLAVSVSLVQGATQTPNPQLQIDDGTNVIFQSTPFASAQNAAVTTQYTWAPGLLLSGGGAAIAATCPLPAGLVLPPGYRISTVTAGKGANTNYGVPSYFVCELGS